MRFVRIFDAASKEAATAPNSLEMLIGCHARIRHFMQLSRTLANARDVADNEITEAAKVLHRYFSRALPLHEADENETLFPRLHDAAKAGALVREAAETMVEQHKVIDELVEELLPMCSSVGRLPGRLPSLAPRLEHVTSSLGEIFLAHLHLEESVIFPAIPVVLTTAEIEEMSREMHQRRQPPPSSIHLMRS